jgi:hypothetical protein
MLHRSLNQMLHRSLNQTLHRSLDQMLHRSLNQMLHRSLNQMLHRSLNQILHRALTQARLQRLQRPAHQWRLALQTAAWRKKKLGLLLDRLFRLGVEEKKKKKKSMFCKSYGKIRKKIQHI